MSQIAVDVKKRWGYPTGMPDLAGELINTQMENKAAKCRVALRNRKMLYWSEIQQTNCLKHCPVYVSQFLAKRTKKMQALHIWT